MSKQVLVPDIGDFEKVEIIEVLVKPGDSIKKNDSLITLESDKSSVEVPSTEDGKIEKYFACVVPYDMLDCNWSETGNSNFSSLTLQNIDMHKIIQIAGHFKSAKKYLKPNYVTV